MKYFYQLAGLVIFAAFSLGLSDYFVEKPAFVFYTADSIAINVFEVRDERQQLQSYWSRVHTPICEDEECYEVELDFHWDILGRFVKYEVIPEKPLTKREHDPFSIEDYAKLQDVLQNENPSFIHFKKDELINKVKSDSLDGYTGATILEVKNEIVSGAAYSCYTLWHIAHGSVADSIRNYTARNLDSVLIHRLASSKDESALYFLIDHFSANDFDQYLPLVLKMIKNHKGYFSRYILEHLPLEVILRDDAQSFFIEEFTALGYFGQLVLVERLQDHIIDPDLCFQFIYALESRNSALNNGLLGLICFNLDQVGKKELTLFLETILTNQLIVPTECYNKAVEKAKGILSGRAVKDFRKSYRKF